MKSLKNKSLFLAFIIMIALFASGCQNIFIPVNVPVVLKEGIFSGIQSPQKISIQSFNVISSGVVQDITNNGNNLIILNRGTTFNIDTFNTDTQQLSSFVNSDKHELSALYDANDTGIYYIEKTIEPNSGNLDSQLLWTDINKNITRTISNPEENVNQFFSTNESNQVVYSNNNNELVLADNEGNRTVYKTLRDYPILSIDYIEDAQGFVFIAYDPVKEEKTNLYYAKIKDDSLELSPSLIAENVNSFDINDVTNQVIFIKNGGESQSIGTWKTSDIKSSTIATGHFGTVKFTPNGENIIYTQYSPNYDSQSQSIWVMDANGDNPLQVTAPLKLSSQVFCHPNKSILYFSAETNAASTNSTVDSVPSQTYQIMYKID
ncbi:hypothetical protein [Acetobacterium tundrae]|uniref:Uncharacterized protein n=1 Tax=Acetobacterium tundrae TaxID=132932 RepID=A0ABR6WKZ9_9FIRM|nr:hypothetical protein [Acetobacterium tundrae]MBC3797116.1 hypothetical protein [Acetobacterium tundrae]